MDNHIQAEADQELKDFGRKRHLSKKTYRTVKHAASHRSSRQHRPGQKQNQAKPVTQCPDGHYTSAARAVCDECGLPLRATRQRATSTRTSPASIIIGWIPLDWVFLTAGLVLFALHFAPWFTFNDGHATAGADLSSMTQGQGTATFSITKLIGSGVAAAAIAALTALRAAGWEWAPKQGWGRTYLYLGLLALIGLGQKWRLANSLYGTGAHLTGGPIAPEPTAFWYLSLFTAAVLAGAGVVAWRKGR